jgi:MFS family permease
MTTTSTSVSRLWRNRDYMILWSGQMLSTLGTSISAVTLPLLILALTGSPAQAGIAGFLQTLPFVVLSLPAGALVDRWDRKRAMIICDLGRGISFLAIPVAYATGHLSIALIYVAVTIHGILFTFFNLAEVAALPQVVSTEQLPAASAQNQAGETASFVVGPLLGGLLFQVVGKTFPFLLDAISYFVSVGSLMLIRVKFQKARTEARRKLAVEIMEGLAWLWRNPLIRYMAFLTGGLNFVFSGLLLAVIVLAQHQGASASVIGLMFAISSIGGIIGSLIGPTIQKRFTFGQAIIGLVWLQALVMPLLAVAPDPILLGVINAVIFVAGPAYNVVQFSYRLALIPDELQGRVNSSFRLLAFGFQPVGLGATGFLIQGFGAVTTVLAFSAVTLILALLTHLNGYVRDAPPLAQAQAA